MQPHVFNRYYAGIKAIINSLLCSDMFLFYIINKYTLIDFQCVSIVKKILAGWIAMIIHQ